MERLQALHVLLYCWRKNATKDITCNVLSLTLNVETNFRQWTTPTEIVAIFLELKRKIVTDWPLLYSQGRWSLDQTFHQCSLPSSNQMFHNQEGLVKLANQ